ncbi:MAG: hypothetical protein WCG31_01620 [Deltaproteobacteria bacterium]
MLVPDENWRIDKVAVKPYYGTMSSVAPLLALIIFALLINIPLGSLRRNYEKFTVGWYFYLHISIPAIVYLRLKSGLSWEFIPLTLAGAIAGQLLGSSLYGRRSRND